MPRHGQPLPGAARAAARVAAAAPRHESSSSEPAVPRPIRIGLSLSSPDLSRMPAPLGSTAGASEHARSGDLTNAGRDGRVYSPEDVSELPILLAWAVPRSEYPAEARRDGVEGTVPMRLVIDARGDVQDAAADPGHGLGACAVRVARRYYRFRPARRDGDPVAVRIPFTIRFELP